MSSLCSSSLCFRSLNFVLSFLFYKQSENETSKENKGETKKGF